MKKKNIDTKMFDQAILALIERISSFQCYQVGLGVYNLINNSYELTTLRNPSMLKRQLEEDSESFDSIYAFASFLPEIHQKIFNAFKDTPIKISIEADLPSRVAYTVMCLIDPECGMTNVEIDEELRLESYSDPVYPRIHGDFFLKSDL